MKNSTLSGTDELLAYNMFILCAKAGKACKSAGYLVAELVRQKGGVELEI